ncbi:hypothetical protein LR48_Vigan08g147400 [Vigna angularis]|uniref:Uncharacterized protein n=1 Tax=Phaseolus angularis TaxID=3914 RepID=A0A0L9V6U2_PHAAN|nr:hypothetical protein LR48_Vigan08g147400 [Vigna angularis]
MSLCCVKNEVPHWWELLKCGDQGSDEGNDPYIESLPGKGSRKARPVKMNGGIEGDSWLKGDASAEGGAVEEVYQRLTLEGEIVGNPPHWR